MRSSILISEVWGYTPPRSIDNALQATISRIRTVMTQSGGCRKDIRAVPEGYVLDVPPSQIDALEFRSKAHDILRRSRVDGDECTRVLNIWNGPALMGVRDGPRCFNEATALEALRLRLLERLATLRLTNRDYARAAHEIARLTTENPLNEYYCELRMMALYYLGQHAAALKEFNRFAEVMDQDMGMLPSRRTRDLYSEILTDAKDRIDQRMSENMPLTFPDVPSVY